MCRFLKAETEVTFTNPPERRSVRIIANNNALVCKNKCSSWTKYTTECVRSTANAEHLEKSFYLVIRTLAKTFLDQGLDRYELWVDSDERVGVAGYTVSGIDIKKHRFHRYLHPTPTHGTGITYAFVADPSNTNGYRVENWHCNTQSTRAHYQEILSKCLLQLHDASYKIRIKNRNNVPIAEGSLKFSWSAESSHALHSALSGVSKAFS